MLWIPVQPLEKPSLKQTRKNTGRKVAASNAINKAILQETAQAKRHASAQREPLIPPKLPVLSLKPSQKKLRLPASPPKSVN